MLLWGRHRGMTMGQKHIRWEGSYAFVWRRSPFSLVMGVSLLLWLLPSRDQWGASSFGRQVSFFLNLLFLGQKARLPFFSSFSFFILANDTQTPSPPIWAARLCQEATYWIYYLRPSVWTSLNLNCNIWEGLGRRMLWGFIKTMLNFYHGVKKDLLLGMCSILPG